MPRCRADPERQRECEDLLGPLPSERFAELVALGKLITDYVGEGEAVVPNDEEGIDDDIGVAVEVRAGVSRGGAAGSSRGERAGCCTQNAAGWRHSLHKFSNEGAGQLEPT